MHIHVFTSALTNFYATSIRPNFKRSGMGLIKERVFNILTSVIRASRLVSLRGMVAITTSTEDFLYLLNDPWRLWRRLSCGRSL
jgi:hypothetical protein